MIIDERRREMKAEELKREFVEKWGWVTPTVLTHDYRDILIKQLNALIEKVIAERMLTDEDAEKAQWVYESEEQGDKDRFNATYCYRDFMAGFMWFRDKMKGGEK